MALSLPNGLSIECLKLGWSDITSHKCLVNSIYGNILLKERKEKMHWAYYYYCGFVTCYWHCEMTVLICIIGIYEDICS